MESYPYPNSLRLPNEAKVSDWLGTVSLHARMAARLVDDVREEKSVRPSFDVDRALERLEDALEELRTVQKAVHRTAIFR